MTKPVVGPPRHRGPGVFPSTDRVPTRVRRGCADRTPIYPAAVLVILAMLASLGTAANALGQGEPAEEFLKRLRAAGYYDTAIAYLGRIDQYPGIDPKLIEAIGLEKAQTFIDAAIDSRNTKTRDDFFQQAEQELMEFLKQGTHPRQSEAQMQLGKLQMVRGAQLTTGQPDQAKRDAARQSYLAAAKTFDEITERLKAELLKMQGAKIDRNKDPEAAALRDQYRAEYLQALANAGESRHYAARTFRSPAEEGKELLEEALKTFSDLSEKYGSYVQGALAMIHRAQIQEDLGNKEQALDNYLRMLEQPEADALRDAKYQAMTGLIRLSMAETPPKFATAITRGQPMVDDIRPNERGLPSVQDLRLELAKAYLAKSKTDDEAVKPAEKKRAESSGRQLLIQATKLPGEQAEIANRMLVDMGIDLEATADLPTAEDPASLEDALSAARELLTTSDALAQSLAILNNQPNQSAEVVEQKKEIETQLNETRVIAIQVLRRGLSMATLDTDIELVHQTRQFLAYMLYQEKRYREAAVVGTFLTRNAPGSESGLRGGLLALNSLQLLLAEEPDNAHLISRLESLGTHLSKTWPNDPDAAAAQGVMIKLALRDSRWDEARSTIEAMPKGPEQAFFYRLMGQLQWNEYVQARERGEETEADAFLAQAQKDLQQGLDGITLKLIDPEGIRSAMLLAKTHLKQGNVEAAAAVLDHETYGPLGLIKDQGAAAKDIASDLYATELQVVVGLMTSDDADATQLLDRAVKVMEKLRKSVEGGENSQAKLTGIYIRMARDIREQLDTALPAKKTRLISAFRLFLERITATTKDPATLQWVGQTLVDLGEASMAANQTKAVGQAAELLQTAVKTFERLKSLDPNAPLTVEFLLGKSYRLVGEYKQAIDVFKELLSQKATMLDAQIEAAKAYEYWAAEVPPKFTGQWYEFALRGAKPGPNKQNIIWGWGKISQQTSRDPKYRDIFFDARYHVALCRYRWGSAIKSKAVIGQASSDITKVHALYPEMGGKEQRAKFDLLLKAIQKALGRPVEGLPKKAPAPQ